MKRAYGYTRSAAGETSHIQIQQMRIKDYCKENNMELVKIFDDSGKSGLRTSQNNSLIEMIAQCRTKDKIHAVLVTDMDRISRNGLDCIFIKNELKKVGTRLIDINQPEIDGSPEEQFIETILAAVNVFNKKIQANKRTKTV